MWLFFSMAALIGGCAGLGKHLEPPGVKLAHIQIKEVKALEAAFEVQLRVFNTNDTALQIKGLTCEIELNAVPFAMGVASAEITIPAYDTAVVPVIVYSSVFDMLRGAHGLQKNEQFQYRLKGELRLAGNVYPSHLPFDAQGRFSLKQGVEKK